MFSGLRSLLFWSLSLKCKKEIKMKNKTKDNTADSLLDELKTSISDIQSLNYTINLQIYDKRKDLTWAVSNVIPKGMDSYADNTFTIVYDPDHSCSYEEYSNYYYASSYEDLKVAVDWIVHHQDLYKVSSTSWSDVFPEDFTPTFFYVIDSDKK